jgi:calcineurin-like phosphoesterase family protein
MRWFISDTHFFHKNIARYTNGADLVDRHTTIINEWNKVIKQKDVVYVIGDVSFGSFEDTRAIIESLKGTKILIRGNHDYRFTSKQFIDMGFADVRDYLFINFSNAEKVLLSHYPYAANPLKRWYYRYIKRSPSRDYYEHYARDCGKWLIHGHHHSGPKVNKKMINVNVDVNNFKPISETMLCKIMNARKK